MKAESQQVLAPPPATFTVAFHPRVGDSALANRLRRHVDHDALHVAVPFPRLAAKNADNRAPHSSASTPARTAV